MISDFEFSTSELLCLPDLLAEVFVDVGEANAGWLDLLLLALVLDNFLPLMFFLFACRFGDPVNNADCSTLGANL